MPEQETFRSGFTAIIGKPNVGKSTLLNNILAEKVSIVTPKPQTTRHQIKGILSGDSYQIVLLDTPGFLKPRYELQKKMLEYIILSLKDADLILYITDAPTYPTDYDLEIIKLINKTGIEKIALLNKTDLVQNDQINSAIQLLQKENFAEIMPISALHIPDLEKVKETILKYMPYNPPYYAKDELSDLPLRFFIQEIIREQIFNMFRDEIPYSSTVVIEFFKEYDNKLEIAANIWLERRSQKIILIGKKGEKIKQLRLAAEKEIHKIIPKRVKLQLWIKLKSDWRQKKNALKEFGYI